MDQLHRTLAIAAVAGTILAIAWTLVLVARRRGPDSRLDSLEYAVVGVVALNAALGLFQLLSGHAPQEQIHLLYGVLAVAAVPFARSFAGRLTPRGTMLVGLAGIVALGLFLFRLFGTG